MSIAPSASDFLPLPAGATPACRKRVNANNTLETKSLIAGQTCVGPCDLNSVPNSYRQAVLPRSPGSAIAAEIALQRAYLEVTPEIGFNTLRRGDGP